MAIIEGLLPEIAIDDEGYLVDPDMWNDRVACALAEREGIEELTVDRMAIIRFLRNYYQEYHSFPLLRGVCRRLTRPKDCYSEVFLDPLKAWKIAGLPRPDEHIVAEIRGEGGVV